MANINVALSDTLTQIANKVTSAAPGDRVRFQSGVYNAGSGSFNWAGVQGTASLPIIFESQGGTVTFTSTKPAVSDTDGDGDIAGKTVIFSGVTKHIECYGLVFQRGVYVQGDSSLPTITGGKNINFAGFKSGTLANFKSAMLAGGYNPSLGPKFFGCTFRWRGYASTGTWDGILESCLWEDIEANTGGFVKWNESANNIARLCTMNRILVNPTSEKHFTNEGVRCNFMSCYNVLEDSTLTDIPHIGRGWGEDGSSSCNTIRRTTINMLGGKIGVSIQTNTQRSVCDRVTVRNADTAWQGGERSPSTGEALPSGLQVTCNDFRTSLGNGQSMNIRRTKNCTFNQNRANDVQCAEPALFVSNNNTWNGANVAPSNGDPGPCGTQAGNQVVSPLPLTLNWVARMATVAFTTNKIEIPQPVTAFWFIQQPNITFTTNQVEVPQPVLLHTLVQQPSTELTPNLVISPSPINLAYNIPQPGVVAPPGTIASAAPVFSFLSITAHTAFVEEPPITVGAPVVILQLTVRPVTSIFTSLPSLPFKPCCD